VAYDHELAQRLRELLEVEAPVTEKKMFGRLAFLVNGNIAIAASGEGVSSFESIRPRPTISSVAQTPSGR
jgi:hypothetical protein